MHPIQPPIQQVNAFLEDTCVLVTAAYLLSRGSLLPKLFDQRRSRRDQLALALIFGLIGASDLLFPGDRLPYVPSTLAASFAGYAGGLGLGLLSAGVMVVLFIAAGLAGGPHLPPLPGAFAVLAALVGAAAAWGERRAAGDRWPRLLPLLLGAFAAGAVAEALRASGRITGSATLSAEVVSVIANGFGCLLLTLVLQDAHERRQAAQRLLRSERENAALRLTQLSELQARLHPHFLFNALAAIAGLCVLRPPEAERAVTALAALLRRFLHAPAERSISLREELATVRLYLSIEKLRMGERLCVTEEVPDELLSCPVPRFCLQIPVENAVQHGIAPSPRAGRIRIVARRHCAQYLFLAVIDNGLGSAQAALPRPDTALADAPLHGLTLLARRLRLAGPHAARLRLSSRAGEGTLCALRLPL